MQNNPILSTHKNDNCNINNDILKSPKSSVNVNSSFKPNLIGFENGVYDLDLSEFRLGKSDDLISLTTGYNYVPFDDTNGIILEINRFFNELFGINHPHILFFLSSLLHGNNTSKTFDIWVGMGCNGKSTLISLLKKTLGEYIREIPATFYTGHDTCKDMTFLNGARLCTTSFIENEDKLSMKLIDKLSNNHTILCCNEMPTILHDKQNILTRVKVIRLTHKFVDNPDPNNAHELQINRNLQQKLDKWKEAFMYILLKYYQTHHKKN